VFVLDDDRYDDRLNPVSATMKNLIGIAISILPGFNYI
jgi:hypothetical protein